MDKQTFIDKIRLLGNRSDLLCILNEVKAELTGSHAYPFTPKQIAYLCNPNKADKRYRKFSIPKKTGGVRTICAPCGNLKWMQLCLNEIFKAIYTPSEYAMGFTCGRSVVDNALLHNHQNYVFNLDLKDFFPSISQARVWKRLQLAPFNFNKDVASVIAGLCCMKVVSDEEGAKPQYILPQGAPTSPLLTNAICDTLDRRLHGLANRFGLRYSRYADDITFSSMHNIYREGGEFRMELQRIISGQNFTINSKKTRLQHCSERQEVTGLTVGRKVNVVTKYVKDVRAILHIWEKYGEQAAYAAFYPRYKAAKGHLHKGEPNIENVISGKLCYLKMVKGENDPVYVKLYAQFARILKLVKPQYTHDWEYLFTVPMVEFERQLGVKIVPHVKKDESNPKPYATFVYDSKSFLVAVSRGININAIPGDAEISLCRVAEIPEFYLAHAEDRQDIDYSKIKRNVKMLYLLHRHHNKNAKRTDSDQAHSSCVVPDSLKETVIEIAQLFPELQLKDEYGIIEQATNDSLLERLVNSDFDLSILP